MTFSSTDVVLAQGRCGDEYNAGASRNKGCHSKEANYSVAANSFELCRPCRREMFPQQRKSRKFIDMFECEDVDEVKVLDLGSICFSSNLSSPPAWLDMALLFPAGHGSPHNPRSHEVLAMSYQTSG